MESVQTEWKKVGLVDPLKAKIVQKIYDRRQDHVKTCATAGNCVYTDETFLDVGTCTCNYREVERIDIEALSKPNLSKVEQEIFQEL